MAIADVRIRFATVHDAPQLLAIYAPYVELTAVTFETRVPTLEEFTERIERTLARYPYLVAERDGMIVGYAYAGPFKTRAAYDWAIETSVYVRRDVRRTGAGRALYTALERVLAAQGIVNMNACVAYADRDDEYLTRDSVTFHERLGFKLVGEFHDCAHKFGRWYSVIWMEKHIGEHLADQPPAKPFPEVRAVFEAEWALETKASMPLTDMPAPEIIYENPLTRIRTACTTPAEASTLPR